MNDATVLEKIKALPLQRRVLVIQLIEQLQPAPAPTGRMECPVKRMPAGHWYVLGLEAAQPCETLAKVLTAMCEIFPSRGLSLSELDSISGLAQPGDCLARLKVLMKSFPETWGAVLARPGGKGRGGYRIRPWKEIAPVITSKYQKQFPEKKK